MAVGSVGSAAGGQSCHMRTLAGPCRRGPAALPQLLVQLMPATQITRETTDAGNSTAAPAASAACVVPHAACPASRGVPQAWQAAPACSGEFGNTARVGAACRSAGRGPVSGGWLPSLTGTMTSQQSGGLKCGAPTRASGQGGLTPARGSMPAGPASGREAGTAAACGTRLRCALLPVAQQLLDLVPERLAACRAV